ncbi:MAG TPA: GxxExxY protein [Cyclobacteriaceae bacterium]|nr:GxxExxY protein [Cyclobacteriaceae bacterium]
MIKEEYKYSELTGKIIGCAMEVHRVLGNGFQACLPKGSTARRQEVIYQRALALELGAQNIEYAREFEMPIQYKENHIGTRRVDFLVEEKISVEIKAVIKPEDVHLAQAINYLEAYNLEAGLLLNFGSKSLEFKRVINSKFKSAKSFNQLNQSSR